MFENVDIQTTEAYLYYKLTNEPKGSGELKKSTEGFAKKTEIVKNFNSKFLSP